MKLFEKIKVFISAVLALLLGLQIYPLFKSKNDTVLRFAVASDVHIEDGSGSSNEEARLAKLFTTAYAYADS